MSLKFRQAFRATLLCCCWWARSRPKRRINRNSYTFKFQHRAYVNTHCSVVESSSSTNNNNKQQQNNQQSSSPSTPVLCCVTGNGGVTTHLENRPLVGIFACDSPRRLSFESHCPSQPDTVERML